MTYTKQTVFTLPLTTAHQIRDDSALAARMKIKEDDMVARGVYDRNIQWDIATVGGVEIATTHRKFPDLAAAQEWKDYGSAETTAAGYSWTSFDIVDAT